VEVVGDQCLVGCDDDLVGEVAALLLTDDRLDHQRIDQPEHGLLQSHDRVRDIARLEGAHRPPPALLEDRARLCREEVDVSELPAVIVQ